jgi:hypothetical protein
MRSDFAAFCVLRRLLRKLEIRKVTSKVANSAERNLAKRYADRGSTIL